MSKHPDADISKHSFAYILLETKGMKKNQYETKRLDVYV